MRKSIIIVLAALAASIAAPAAAEKVSVAVTFDDLDLASAAGMATLDRRIAAAVDKVCGMAVPTEIWARAALNECRAETLADAKRQQAAIAP